LRKAIILGLFTLDKSVSSNWGSSPHSEVTPMSLVALTATDKVCSLPAHCGQQ
jgi:hypothetical protein